MPTVAAVQIANIFQHTFIGDIRGRRTELVTKWEAIAVTGVQSYPTGIQDIQTALTAAIKTLYLACLSPDWNCQLVLTQRIAESETAFPPVRSKGVYATSSGAGTFTGVNDQPGLAGEVVRFNYLTGRMNQGALRIGPLPNAAVVQSVLSGTAVTKLAALATVLVSNVSAAAGAITLAPVAWRVGTKGHAQQPSASQLFGFIIGPNYTTMNRRKPLPLNI